MSQKSIISEVSFRYDNLSCYLQIALYISGGSKPSSTLDVLQIKRYLKLKIALKQQSFQFLENSADKQLLAFLMLLLAHIIANISAALLQLIACISAKIILLVCKEYIIDYV